MSKAGLCSIDSLPLPGNTRQYHAVVFPENVFQDAHFLFWGEGGKKPSKKFQIFNYPMPFDGDSRDGRAVPGEDGYVDT